MVSGTYVRCALLGLFITSPGHHAMAHHGWSGNTAGNIEITGVVEAAVSLSGPHGTMQIRDAEGQLWDITLAPGPRTHRAGLKENTIPLGATVTVHGQRNADEEKHEAKVRRVIWDGTEFNVYPSR
ncbi:MAG: DUF6152 family protein [Pseudomonadota bacterium]